MSGQQDLAWETQDGVRSLQAALNSQPPVPMPLASWDTNTNSIPKLEGLDTIDLSTTPLMRSSPPVARPTILPQRSLVVTHPYSTPMGETVHQSHNPPQYVNLDGELLSQSPHSGKRVRVKSREKSGETGEVRPCRVCGERAGKHSYYGGQVCPSCRAFFRRSVQSGYNATYFCVKDGNCEVTLKTRKNCQYCRYKLCEAAGMKTTWVLTDEERKQKFDGKGKKRRSSSVGQSDHNLLKIKTDDNAHLSEDDIAAISNYVAASDYWEISKVHDMSTELIRKIIRMIAFRAALDQSGQDQLQLVMINRVQSFANKIAEFTSLSHHDKEQILSNNVPLVVILSTCSMFSTKMLWTTQLTPILGAQEVEKLNTKLRSLAVSGLNSLSMTYTQLFQTQADDTEEKTRLVQYIGEWTQDPTELILLSLLILFCPDMLDLVERGKVEEIQLKFAVLLQNFLNHKNPTDLCLARNKFTKGMLVINKCKEMVMIGRQTVE